MCIIPLQPYPATCPRSSQLLLVVTQDNIFEWHFAVRGPPDTEFQVRVWMSVHIHVPGQACRGKLMPVPCASPGWHLPRAHPVAARVPLQASFILDAVAERPL